MFTNTGGSSGGGAAGGGGGGGFAFQLAAHRERLRAHSANSARRWMNTARRNTTAGRRPRRGRKTDGLRDRRNRTLPRVSQSSKCHHSVDEHHRKEQNRRYEDKEGKEDGQTERQTEQNATKSALELTMLRSMTAARRNTTAGMRPRRGRKAQGQTYR